MVRAGPIVRSAVLTPTTAATGSTSLSHVRRGRCCAGAEAEARAQMRAARRLPAVQAQCADDRGSTAMGLRCARRHEVSEKDGSGHVRAEAEYFKGSGIPERLRCHGRSGFDGRQRLHSECDAPGRDARELNARRQRILTKRSC